LFEALPKFNTVSCPTCHFKTLQLSRSTSKE
jgi:hypothetical protein